MDFYKAEIGEPDFKKLLPDKVDWKDGVYCPLHQLAGRCLYDSSCSFQDQGTAARRSSTSYFSSQNLKTFWQKLSMDW